MRRAGLRPDAQTHNLVLEAVAKAARSGKAPPPSLPFPVLTGHASSLPRTNWTRFVHRTGKPVAARSGAARFNVQTTRSFRGVEHGAKAREPPPPSLLLPLPVSLLYTPSPLSYCCPYPCPYCTLSLLTTAEPLSRRASRGATAWGRPSARERLPANS